MDVERHNMSDQASAELWELASRYCNDSLDAADVARLELLLAEDTQARSFFGIYVSMHGELTWRFRGGEAKGSSVNDPDSSAIVQPYPSFPALSTTHHPLTTNFIGGPVFSYMVATLILCVMLLSAWAYKITRLQQQIVQSPSQSAPSLERPEMVFVGQITGMLDCEWSDVETETYAGASVPLGRNYALSSGLMQITYDSGAKVILEGPCNYTVSSKNGGYLGLGKLTARVEKRGERGGERGEKRVARNKGRGLAASAISTEPQAANHKSSSLIPHPSPLFSVTTPTAVVTDLGTEFGVRVDEEGHTATLVFDGTVRMNISDGKAGKDDNSVTLQKNESAQTCKHGDSDGSLALHCGGLEPREFVRSIAKLPKVLDLLDIVAGGDGMGQHRESGINPVTGIEDRVLSSQYREAGPGYRPWYLNISWHKLIDGVFIPDGRMGKVQINSAGYKYAGFPKTDGKAFSSIWARAATVGKARWRANRSQWIYAIEPAERYMPDNRGLLGLHANAGITFDLGEMRVAYRGTRPARFLATAALADANGNIANQSNADQSADVWVFVDDQLKLHRLHLSPKDGELAVDIELGPKDRFLTLVTTDGGDGSLNDWIVFGDPILEMIEEDAKRDGLEKSEEKGK